MEAIAVHLCKVEPDPIFIYPIPGSPYPASANFKITNIGIHKIAYKIRYGNKHPNMDIRIHVDNKGTLSPGQHLLVPVSLEPGYDVNKDKNDSFTFCVYAMPLYTINNFRSIFNRSLFFSRGISASKFSGSARTGTKRRTRRTLTFTPLTVTLSSKPPPTERSRSTRLSPRFTRRGLPWRAC